MEDTVQKQASRLIWLYSVLLLAVGSFCVAQEPPPPSNQPPANVAGKWTIYSVSPEGRTETKYLELKQNGETLTGHFKGPNQSGGLEGTIQERHLVFKTKTRHVLTFRGHVEGEKVNGVVQATKIIGKWHFYKGTGTWEAVRAD